MNDLDHIKKLNESLRTCGYYEGDTTVITDTIDALVAEIERLRVEMEERKDHAADLLRCARGTD